MNQRFALAAAMIATVESGAVVHANALVTAGTPSSVAHSRLTAKPVGEWNRLSRADGRNVEVWTLDGDALNKVSFYGGVESGKTLLREPDKKRQPLPKISATMLMTDIPALLESTYRSLGIVNQMNIGEEAPATLGGHKAIHFTYTLTRADDDVSRKGEGTGTLVDGKLYLITYEAPAVHFFDRDLDRYRQLAASLSL